MTEQPEDPNPIHPAQRFGALMAEGLTNVAAAMEAAEQVEGTTPLSIATTTFQMLFRRMLVVGIDGQVAATALLETFESVHDQPMNFMNIARAKETLESMAENRKAREKAKAARDGGLIGLDGQPLKKGQ